MKFTFRRCVMLSQVDKNSVMIMTEADGKEWSFLPLGEIEFQCGEVQKINLTDEVWNIVFNLQDQSLRTLILNEKDYNNLISENSREINKYMINCNGKTETESVISTMLKNVTVDNLTVREEGINYQYVQRRIMVVFTFLTELVMLACLIIFQMLRLIAEKEKWKHSKKILWILGVEKAKLYKQIEDRMSLQTLYPAFGGGILGLAFSQILQLCSRISLYDIGYECGGSLGGDSVNLWLSINRPLIVRFRSNIQRSVFYLVFCI